MELSPLYDPASAPVWLISPQKLDFYILPGNTLDFKDVLHTTTPRKHICLLKVDFGGEKVGKCAVFIHAASEVRRLDISLCASSLKKHVGPFQTAPYTPSLYTLHATSAVPNLWVWTESWLAVIFSGCMSALMLNNQVYHGLSFFNGKASEMWFPYCNLHREKLQIPPQSS